MVEIIWKMAPIIESMPVIFPLNILSSPMDAMSGEQSNFWGNWTNSLWTEIYSGGKIYKDSPTPKLRIESSYCETQLPVLISWVALYSLVFLSVRRGDISFPPLTIYPHCIGFVHCIGDTLHRLCPLYRRYTASPLSTVSAIHCIAFVQQHHLHHEAIANCHHHPCLLCERRSSWRLSMCNALCKLETSYSGFIIHQYFLLAKS